MCRSDISNLVCLLLPGSKPAGPGDLTDGGFP